MTERRRITTGPKMAEGDERCRHFRGMMNDHPCALGIDIRQLVGGPDTGWATRAPCRHIYGMRTTSDQPRVPCDHYRGVTQAEKDEVEAEMAKHLERLIIAQPVVDAFRLRHKRENAQETVVCPTGCGGRLTLSIAACNGHVSGRCSTPGCLAWME